MYKIELLPLNQSEIAEVVLKYDSDNENCDGEKNCFGKKRIKCIKCLSNKFINKKFIILRSVCLNLDVSCTIVILFTIRNSYEKVFTIRITKYL